MSVRARDESGFTMIMTVIAITLVALLAAVAVTAVSGSAQVTGRDISRKQAYAAALAGINEYAFHLHANSGYWAECTKAVPSGETSALNQEGSTANRRPVPGGSGATYALELLPATGHTSCNPTNIETATSSMLEALEPMKGTFRVRATGFSGNTQTSVTATFKPASFLDYVYFTQLETSDPVTYGNEELIKAANQQCTKTIRDGRYEAAFTNASGSYLNAKGEVLHLNGQGQYVNSKNEKGSLQYCDAISFVEGDNIKGPMHTNDAFVICGSPTLGRNASDPIEVSSPEPGWYSTSQIPNSGSNCTGHNTNFKGTFRVNSPVLIPPETNSELETIAESTFRFSGEVKICLEGSKLTIGRGTSCTETVLYSGPFPANGVIYDSSQTCSGAYSPFAVNYEKKEATCGNVNVEGKYAKPLTIAAANNVLIMGNIEKSSEEGMLGLIANNFIRVYHPVKLTKTTHTENGVSVTEETCTSSSENLSGTLKNVKIEAALLAIKHSFIVDNYNCGPQLEKLNVKGAIAQKFRGAVGTTGNTGYLKNYEYDERLKTTEPPSFIEPIKSDWVIGRETTE